MNTLYNSNRIPSRTTPGTGFKDEEKALETIKITNKLIKNKKINKTKQMLIILTMYYRAEHHPYKNTNMKKAQKIFKKWLISHGYENSIKRKSKK